MRIPGIMKTHKYSAITIGSQPPVVLTLMANDAAKKIIQDEFPKLFPDHDKTPPFVTRAWAIEIDTIFNIPVYIRMNSPISN